MLLDIMRMVSSTGTIANFSQALWVVFAFVLCSKNVNGGNNGLALEDEVVSIYSKNFTNIPKDREPFYVKVHRCVLNMKYDGYNVPGLEYYPQPTKMKEIEIVVPDLKNYKKFYKYIVYDHISCNWKKWLGQPMNFDLHKNLTSNEINETEFKSKVNYNPPNVRGCNDYCKNQQPRFYVHSEPMAVNIDQLFIPLKQCLPGCKATENILNVRTKLKTGFYTHFIIIKHTSCNPWSPSTQSQADSNLLAVLNTSKSQSFTKHQRESDEDIKHILLNKGLFLYITSPKMIFAAFVLTIVLISILILDCSLCCRKKGIMYLLLTCGKKKECKDCIKSKQTMIEMIV
ncbi:uncharacterized protein LOC124433692 isoform X2 [Xenia sp. Carnegie-2017]|uniref:uncharacterized protein LOC124433692 isoform X2 n=1 Tax=Xenia sp. Carnegie-2017 TaxID=2897299 RepID=UPI001F04E1ED|nr:uncharacterized protein LOC124433692 isoform X2 [Xenia sp. Carnegie-2017]